MTIAWTDHERHDRRAVDMRPLPPPAGRDGWIVTAIMVLMIAWCVVFSI